MPKDIKATNWSVTINNPTKNDDEYIALARQKGWKVEGQLEMGDSGTQHFQLLVTTKGQQRFTALKKAFPRAHIEPCRDVTALRKYVNKEDTRIGELAIESQQYPSLQTLWDLYAEWLDDKDSWWNWNGEKALEQFDLFIAQKIEQGFIVETMAVNPQIRSCVKNYFVPIIFRSNLRRQTPDRQTAENNISSSNINAENQEITLPQTSCDETSSLTSSNDE
jgi:hypothetical protein